MCLQQPTVETRQWLVEVFEGHKQEQEKIIDGWVHYLKDNPESSIARLRIADSEDKIVGLERAIESARLEGNGGISNG